MLRWKNMTSQGPLETFLTSTSRKVMSGRHMLQSFADTYIRERL